jgi:FkbM family methyltransferase
MAERFSRGVVLRRRLPSQFHRLPIYVTPEAGLRYWSAMSQVDPLLYRMAEELVKPGSVVWDVGANVGLFAFCAASRAGHSGSVLAIEPDLWLAQLISLSSRHLEKTELPCAKVKTLCASVSDSNSVCELEIATRARSANHLLQAGGSSQAEGTRYRQLSPSLTLDFLLESFPPPSVLKIDVETHEASVLRGAKRLLAEVQPVIWCEVSPENSAEVTTLLLEAEYELYGADSQPHQRAHRAWFNTLGVPSVATHKS